MRAKLIGEQITLLTVVCLIIVVTTVFALRLFLVGRLDEQLTGASQRAASFVGGRPPQPPPDGPPDGRRDPLDAPGQGAGTINAAIENGTVLMAERLSYTGQRERLPAEQKAVLVGLPVDNNPHTVDLGAFGDYRLLAVRASNDVVVITGLPMNPVEDTVIGLALILGGVALGGLLAAGVVGAVIVRRTLRPLQRVAATASRVTELPLHSGEVALGERVPDEHTDARTEVGQVGLALNRMLDHVGDALAVRHASETRVRQFVADASHELRTPLAAIRGYAEFVRRGKEPVSEEVAHAVGRVESEATRMTALVEDLLLLARLDAGRPLELEQVDLSRIVVDAVSDARIAGGDHRWRLELPAEPVTVVGDESRLRQVLVNLLSNARVHTPPGTTVTTGLAAGSAGEVVLTVTDDGPGIPAALLPEVFERFARGDSSRSRAAGSTGLGLSIVAAVVAAHGGTAGVTSTPGHTVFSIRLSSTRD